MLDWLILLQKCASQRFCILQSTRLSGLLPLGTLTMDAFSALAGMAFTLAFAPFNYALLTPLSLAFLFLGWRQVSPRRAALRGYYFGLGSFGLGISWVYVSIHDFGGSSIWLAGFMSAVFCGFWAIFPALAGYLSTKFAKNNNASMAIPLVWVLVEFLRGQIILGGFPWLVVGYSQLDTLLAGYVPLVGTYGTGVIVAFSALIISQGFNKDNHRLWLLLWVLWSVGGVLKMLDWTQPAGTALQVTLLQGNITQDQKWLPQNRLNSMLRYQNLTAQHWDSQLVIWPETAIPVYWSQVREFLLMPLMEAGKLHHTDILVSLPEDADEGFYNAVMLLGQTPGTYRKRHLLPFGETLPWQPFSGWLMAKLGLNLGTFSAGSENQPLLKSASYSFSTSICYEDAFSDTALNAMPSAAFLVNVTNDAWFGDSLEPYQHLQLARMRALETGRFLLRATNTGASAVIAPNGKITAQAPLFKETALTAKIIPMQGRTPFSYMGDWPIAGLLLLGYAGVFLKALYAKS